MFISPTITAVRVHHPRAVRRHEEGPADLTARLLDHVVTATGRRGKPGAQLVDLAGEDQWRQHSDLGRDVGDDGGLGPHRLLPHGAGAPVVEPRHDVGRGGHLRLGGEVVESGLQHFVLPSFPMVARCGTAPVDGRPGRRPGGTRTRRGQPAVCCCGRTACCFTVVA